jgi:hypothetical protein
MTDSRKTINLTAKQIDLVLCDIATTAKQIDSLVSLLVAGCDQIDNEAFYLSIEYMAQRIGWAADMAMTRSECSIGPCFGSAEMWMMPRSFHNATERSSQGNALASTANTLGRA